MDELNSFADLAHENGACAFSEDEIVINDPFKQFATFDEFQQEANLLFAIVVRVVELNQPRIAQRFHYFHFTFDVESVGFLWRLNEFGSQTKSSALLPALVNRPKFASLKNLNLNLNLNSIQF